MTAAIKSITYPTVSIGFVVVQVYDDEVVPDGSAAAGVTIIAHNGGTLDSHAVFQDNDYIGSYRTFSTRTGSGSFVDPIVFSFRPERGWGVGRESSFEVYVRGQSLGIQATNERKPVTSYNVGRMVHYYPRVGEPNYGLGGGVTAAITANNEWPTLSVNNGGSTVKAVKARKLRRGDPGTWEPLDFRHRRHLRLHGSHVEYMLDQFEADSTLLNTFWPSKRWDFKGVNGIPSCIDFIVQLENPPIGSTWGPKATSAFSRAATLGIPMNLGILTVSAMTQTSDWWTLSFWQGQADRLNYYWNLIQANAGEWLHLQMECVEPVQQATQSALTAAGITRAQLKAAMQPFLDAITNTGCKTIVRPYSPPGDLSNPDVAMPLIIEAGAEGSVYCSEFQTVIGRTFRQSEFTTHASLGGGLDTERPFRPNRFNRQMPRDSEHVPLRSGNEIYNCGDIMSEYPFELDSLYCVFELVELVDGFVSGGFVHPREIGARAWYYNSYKANTGQHQSSVNPKITNLYTIANEKSDGNNLDVKAKRMHGADRGTTNALDFMPWRRVISGGVQTTDANVTPPAFPLAGGWLCKEPSNNDVRFWRMSPLLWRDPVTLVNTTSFFMRGTFKIPTLPSSGRRFCVVSNVQFNSRTGAFDLTVTDTGALELRTIASSGAVDTFTVLASTPTATKIRWVFGYDASTFKWIFGATGGSTPVYTAPASNYHRDPSGLAIAIGGGNDLVNFNTQLNGSPEMLLPSLTDIMFGRIAITAAEATCLLQDELAGFRWPYNYDFF